MRQRPSTAQPHASRRPGPTLPPASDRQLLEEILAQEQDDERLKYLVNYGQVKKVLQKGHLILSELNQIPGTCICYRTNQERQALPKRIQLDAQALTHIPLMEGEEKLETLVLQDNHIRHIENLVSLHNLMHLDLQKNGISEINNLEQLGALKILNLGSNHIGAIKNLEHTDRLEVLDLQANHIRKIENMQCLERLKVLNLAANQITKVEGLTYNLRLVELHLQRNQVKYVESMNHLYELMTLDLSDNLLNNLMVLKKINKIQSLHKLSLQKNKIGLSKQEYYSEITAVFPNLKLVDGLKYSQVLQQQKQVRANRSEKQLSQDNDTSVLKKNTSQEQLDTQPPQKHKKNLSSLEKSYISDNDKQPRHANYRLSNNFSLPRNPTNPKRKLQSSYEANRNSSVNRGGKAPDENRKQSHHVHLQQPKVSSEEEEGEVQATIRHQWNTLYAALPNPYQRSTEYQNTEGGHAELEDQDTLYVYGNAYEVILQDNNFQRTVRKIHMHYTFLDKLIDDNYFVQLQKFRRLESLHLKYNHIYSFVQISKLESLPSLKELSIYDNPVNTSANLKSFVVYRLGNLTRFNGHKISDQDKKKSKAAFQQFDKVLQIPEKFQQFDSRSMEYIVKEDKTESISNSKASIKALNRQLTEQSQQQAKGAVERGRELAGFEAEFEGAFTEVLQDMIANHESLV